MVTSALGSPRSSAAAAAGRTSSFTGRPSSDEDLDLGLLLQRVDVGLAVVLFLLLAEELLDLRRGFVEGDRAARLVVDDLDDVIPELGGDDAADLSGLQLERDLVEFRNHLAFREGAQIAALRGAAVLRVLLRELGEVGAGLRLLQDRVDLRARLLFRRRVRLRVDADVDVARHVPLCQREAHWYLIIDYPL